MINVYGNQSVSEQKPHNCDRRSETNNYKTKGWPEISEPDPEDNETTVPI